MDGGLYQPAELAASGAGGSGGGAAMGRGLLAAAVLPGNSSATMDISISGALDQQLTIMWVLLCSFQVFFMQSGFAMLEAGTVRIKNLSNIMLKNVIDACVSTVAWWALGYAFAIGAAYLIYTCAISAFVYPVVAHWVWSESGWLSARRRPTWNCGVKPVVYEPLIANTMGTMDFAGSGVVHMVGGGAALVGAALLGPRLGRFSQDGHAVQFSNASAAHMALGVFILWLGWYGFNAGSTQCFYGCMQVAATIAVNTTLATGAGGLTCLFLSVFFGAPGDIGPLLNGILAGAVSITASCAMVHSYAAVVIGAVGAAVYLGASKLLLRLRIDDPVDAAPVHFFCGAWGVLAVGFFATETFTNAAYGYAADWGVFYGGSGRQLGMQLLGMLCIAAWTCSLSFILFWCLRKAGWLRVDKESEQQGLDIAQVPSRKCMP
ncbi:hypothetical protein COHA_000169 [Chlorella ohadii]|uniref:Ammonium transporter AmtB-like domain-containing protein n=1 Tax=Chlorella ohadii TaxID=2649997 RepID=A0AAD5DXN0_9CHLO|nr:hypothetical protein COHA_000169 [Chlorella ohadii]